MPEVLLCSIAEVPAGEIVCKRVAGFGEVAVVRLSDSSEYVAFESRCPHARGPLGEGELRGDVVVCPWHFFRFDLRTGKPPGTTSILELRRYPVTVRGSEIFVETAVNR